MRRPHPGGNAENPMPIVEPGSFLTLHYRLAGPQGDIINTFSDKPATLSLGSGELTPAVEQRHQGRKGLAAGRRLSCQARLEGDIVIDVPPESQVHRQVIRKSATQRDIVMDPATRTYYVEVAEPDMHEPSGDLERLAAALESQLQIKGLQADLAVMARLQPVLRKGNWQVTAAVQEAGDGTAPRLVALFPGYREAPLYGLAIDLGSTTIAGHLVALDDGRVLTETRAICTWLEGRWPEPNLMGVDADERAFIEMADRRVELYLMAGMANCIRHTHPGLAALEQPQFAEFGRSQGEKVRETARWFDAWLQQHPWMAGDRFTIADITAFCAVEFARLMKFVPGEEGLHALQAWRDRVAERPSAKVV